MAFHNVEFPSDYSLGAIGGPEFRTTIVGSGSGYEQRNVDWDSARCKFDVSRVLADPDTRDGAIEFFRARKGMAHSFLFKDHNDFYVGMAWNSTVLEHDSGNVHVFATGDNSETEFQLYKVYSSGGFTETRKITRPVDAIKVYLDGVEQTSGVTVDYTTGIVTFSSAPGTGVEIGWTGEFRVPVRFDTDYLPMEYTGATVGNVSLTVVEVRE